MTAPKAKATTEDKPAAAEVEPPKPSICRLVLVPMDPKSNNGVPTAAAVITHVWDDVTVDLRILQNNAGIPIWRGNARLVTAIPDYADGEGVPNVWAWPPRS